MNASELLRALQKPKHNPATLARKVAAEPDLANTLLAALEADSARVRFGSARVLESLSEQSPRTLYPHFRSFVRLLDHPNRVLQWEAIRILAQLTRVDEAGQFAGIFRRFFAPIRGPVMITAANILGAAPVIARARPEWAERILRQVLRVEAGQYQTTECRHVAIGHALQTCQGLLPLLHQPRLVAAFAQRQLDNPRPATRRKAEKLQKAVSRPRG